jgi:hypothetical protein
MTIIREELLRIIKKNKDKCDDPRWAEVLN